MELEKSMEVSANPISLTEKGDEKVKIRTSWTRFGVIFAGVGLAFFGVGMWRVDGVMAAMGLSALVLLVFVRFLGIWNIKGISLGYRGPRRVEVARGFDAKLELHCGKRVLDGFLLDFGVGLLGEKEVCGRVIWLGSNSSATMKRWVSLKHRGLKKEQVGWIRSSFPMGLFEFSSCIQIPSEIGVVPFARVPRELSFSGFLLDGAPLGGSKQFGGMGDWKGLREWRNGDAVRKIAWAASMRSQASGGGLLVRQEEPPGSRTEACVIVFHSYGTDRNLIRPDRFERALSLLCGAAGNIVGSGIPVRVLADFWEWEPMELSSKRGLAQLRERLMLVKRAEWTEAHNLLDTFSQVKSEECLIILSDMPESSWKSLVPNSDLNPLVVDIVAYEKSTRRKFLRGKAVAR
ncbi:MAG: DUF58 domain-containing protein [Akkermansiaceae bacterium]|jgi:uncharacterized protein (DUF58 family)